MHAVLGFGFGPHEGAGIVFVGKMGGAAVVGVKVLGD